MTELEALAMLRIGLRATEIHERRRIYLGIRGQGAQLDQEATQNLEYKILFNLKV